MVVSLRLRAHKRRQGNGSDGGEYEELRVPYGPAYSVGNKKPLIKSGFYTVSPYADIKVR